jgi:hypothetical protein
MFNLNSDGRLSAWSNLRKQIDISEDPLRTVMDFWASVTFSPCGPVLDPFYKGSWPTPWEIVVNNKYDDFSKAVMIGYSLLLTERFKNSNIQVRTMVDKDKKQLYNAVYIDDAWVLNFKDGEAIPPDHVPNSCNLENLVELTWPR